MRLEPDSKRRCQQGPACITSVLGSANRVLKLVLTFRQLGYLILSVSTTSICPGGTLELQPSKDATLYESVAGQLANGAGSVLIVGRTGRSTDSIRRALLQFEFTEVPANAIVTSAELSVVVSRAPSSDTFPVDLHRVLNGWGEGPSDAVSAGDGQGIAAEEGDATWTHAVFPEVLWQTEGGEFASESSGSTLIGDTGNYSWEGASLVNDINHWLFEPESNFGWILIGDETQSRSARRINSRSNVDTSSRPTLTLSFDLGPTSGDCNGDGILDKNDLECVCSDGVQSLESTLMALDLLAGDFDGNGEVSFSDFLLLARNFGGPGDYLSGDLDCDGTVRFQDFLVFARNFGRTSQASVSVPESFLSNHIYMLTSLLLTRFRRR